MGVFGIKNPMDRYGGKTRCVVVIDVETATGCSRYVLFRYLWRPSLAIDLRVAVRAWSPMAGRVGTYFYIGLCTVGNLPCMVRGREH